MYISCIDETPLREGWGRIYQGGWVTSPDKLRREVPGPLAIVGLNHDKVAQADWDLIDRKQIVACLSAAFPDSAEGVLPDALLLSLVDAGIALLAGGTNLYIHCVAGVSRSTYYHTALRMRVQGIGFSEALAQIVARRPEVKPIDAFAAHLRRLEPVLMAGAR